jgi:hypothetical protein
LVARRALISERVEWWGKKMVRFGGCYGLNMECSPQAMYWVIGPQLVSFWKIFRNFRSWGLPGGSRSLGCVLGGSVLFWVPLCSSLLWGE